MIDLLKIEHFKCFKHATFSIRPLTVLTGLNGGGKSTVLQALLLARLALLDAPNRAVRLNGPFGLALGAAQDVLNWAAPEPSIHIRVSDSVSSNEWRFAYRVPDTDGALHLVVEEAPDDRVPGLGNSQTGFTYLCAERLGPRDMLSVSAQEPEEIGVGVRGEFTAQVLALRETRGVNSRETVREDLRHRDVSSPLPRLQAEAWASEIIRPIRITAQLAVGIMASTIRFEESGQTGDIVRPSNMGFGVSYALPIIVAGILTQPDDVLLVENPEAHLHPAGQSRLGRFLARVAASGVHVIVETHSDHVLNGFRLAVCQERTLEAEAMVVHYFGQHETVAIGINEKGELDQWPSGFFDQIENDLGGLARARRSR